MEREEARMERKEEAGPGARGEIRWWREGGLYQGGGGGESEVRVGVKRKASRASATV